MSIQDALQAGRFATNPFRIVPPADMDNIHWAGDRTVIDDLLEAAHSPRLDALGTSELVVLFGDFGAGKTNALKFLYKELHQEGALVAYLPKPSVADKPAWHDIARSLFSQAFRKADIAERLSKLRKYVQNEAQDRARVELGSEASDLDKLNAMTAKQVREVADEILPEAPGFIEFAVDLASDRKMDRNWRYLAEKPNASLAKEISTEYSLPPDGLSTDYGATLLLTSLIRAITYPTPNGVGSEVVCLLMDEVEDTRDLAPASRMSILQGLRDLFNGCTEHLLIALAAAASDASELWGILDQPIMQRLSRDPIQFAQLDEDRAKDFILELMLLSRTPSYKGDPEWPFTSDGLEAFVQSCPAPLTPRKLLVSAGRICFQGQTAKLQGGSPIDADDVATFTAWVAR